MQKWFEIFRTGNHTSSNGKNGKWEKSDLDSMVLNHNSSVAPVPLVIGHPKENGPAYGFVDKLKRVGTTILALPKQVDSQFSTMVKDGRFPKRSISVNPDGSLRHIGFLGAMPPAVKGLKDVEFSNRHEGTTYDFLSFGGPGGSDLLEDEDFAEDERIATEMASVHRVDSQTSEFYGGDNDLDEDERLAGDMAAPYR